MNVFADFEQTLRDTIEALASQGKLPKEIDATGLTVEPPRDPEHGDVATNVAMVLAKRAAMKPRDFAQLIAARLEEIDDITGVDVAGPGFINVRFAPNFWQRVVAAVQQDGENFGRGAAREGQRVNVEYVSANPTGPLHVGHTRGAVFGDALANLLAFAGYDVAREYYINDAGSQIDTLCRSAFLRYREALGEEIGEIPEGLYPGDYLKPVGEALAAAHGDALKDHDEAGWMPIVREVALAMMMDMIRDDLARLSIRQEIFFSERSMIHGETDIVAATIEELRGKGLIYEGTLEPPKGTTPPDDWENREQTLFRSTEFGDDVDRALIKSDGTYTYFASDMAYHRDKYLRGFNVLIDVWGADHAGYITRVDAAIQALTDRKASFDVKVCQLVRLFRAGEPVKMSKRSGNFVTLRDVVDEVGADPIRFMMLYRKNEAPLDFDFKAVTEQAKENPVFYVQYAHARIRSTLRNAEEEFSGIAAEASGDLDRDQLARLDDAGELGLMKRVSAFPRLVEQAATAHEPHRLAFYLYELASELHAQWNRGKDAPQLRFIRGDDRDLTVARLALVQAVGTVLHTGLGLLGVHAPEEMR
ncbi:MAG: arginine--tRNA ligase [Pseudomonadota bacterium]